MASDLGSISPHRRSAASSAQRIATQLSRCRGSLRITCPPWAYLRCIDEPRLCPLSAPPSASGAIASRKKYSLKWPISTKKCMPISSKHQSVDLSKQSRDFWRYSDRGANASICPSFQAISISSNDWRENRGPSSKRLVPAVAISSLPLPKRPQISTISPKNSHCTPFHGYPLPLHPSAITHEQR